MFCWNEFIAALMLTYTERAQTVAVALSTFKGSKGVAYGQMAALTTVSMVPIVVMVLLGLPFAFKVGRRGSLYGIGVALLLVLVYWAVLAIFNALGLEALFDPWVAAWAPNVLFGLFGFYLMLYVKT